MNIVDNVEQVCCLFRADETISEEALHDAVARFKGPIPITLGVNGRSSGCYVVSVEVRRDDQGAFLAGLVRSEMTSAVIHKESPLRANIVSVGFVPTPNMLHSGITPQ